MKRLLPFLLLVAGCAIPSHVPSGALKTAPNHGTNSKVAKEKAGPDWFELARGRRGNGGSLFASLELTAVGEERAIVLTTLGYVALDKDRGVLGHLTAVDATDQLKIGSGDRVYVMRPSGQLLQFQKTEHLFEEEAKHSRSLGHWRRWRTFDASPACLAIATDDEVSISRDEGASFSASQPNPGNMINGLWCRHDGLVVAAIALSEGVEFRASRDGGTTWFPLPKGPKRLYRDGTFLWGKLEGCPRVLSASGTRWIQTTSERLPKRSAWLRMISLGLGSKLQTFPEPYGSMKLNAVSDRKLRVDSCLEDSTPKDSRPSAGSSNGVTTETKSCYGHGCIERTLNRTPSGLRFVAGLAPGTGVDARPTLIVTDTEQRSLFVRAPPSGCHPEALAQGPGIIILLCRTRNGLAVFASKDGSHWSVEGELLVAKTSSPSLDWAEDGTLLLGGLCSIDEPTVPTTESHVRDCQQMALRSPRAIGLPGLWQMLPFEKNYVATRVMRGGSVLIARADGSYNGPVTLLRYDRGSGMAPICTVSPGLGDLRKMDIDGWNLNFEFATSEQRFKSTMALEREMPPIGACILR